MSILLALFFLQGTTALWFQSESWCPGLVEHPEPRKEPYNVRFAEELAKEVRMADAGKGFDLLFYGDSITEQWRETDQSRMCDRCQGDAELFKKYFGKYRADVLAVGGDQVSHLQWRLLHGEIPVRRKPKVAVIMIGTNDLGAVCDCSQSNETTITASATGVKLRLGFMLEVLQSRLPDTELLLLGLTPRGSGFMGKEAWEWPSIFTPALEDINQWLKEQASVRSGVHYLDCGPDLLPGGKLTPEMFGDGLHPSYEAMDLMGACIAPVVDKLMHGEEKMMYIKEGSISLFASWRGYKEKHHRVSYNN